jgi:rare lipoprotein A
MALIAAVSVACASQADARDMTVRATWYGVRHHGHFMKSGQRFDRFDETTVASRYLRMGTRIEMTNIKNGRKLRAVVRDKSPHSVLDLSEAGAIALDFKDAGRATLRVAIIN